MRLALRTGLMVLIAFTSFAQTDTNTPSALPIEKLMESSVFTNATQMVMVRISKGFWAGQTHVTQKAWTKIMTRNPSQFPGDNKPVDSVSYTDALNFCAALTAAEKNAKKLPDGWAYTLPTQGEWEQFAAGTKLEDSYHSLNGKRTGTTDVASLPANNLGLYDTRGLLWQWCLDPQDKPYRVLRGGAWDTAIEINLRPEFRWYSRGLDERQNIFGFRVVLKPATK